LVFYSSVITMVHGPTNIRLVYDLWDILRNETGNVRTYYVTVRHDCVAIVAVEKQNIINYKCLSYSACKSHLLLSSATCLPRPHFSTLPHKGQDFRVKILSNIKCVLIFSTTLVWNISHYEKNLAIYYSTCTCLHVKYPLFWSDILSIPSPIKGVPRLFVTKHYSFK